MRISPPRPLRAAFKKRNYFALRQTLRVDPRVWQPSFRQSFVLAREASQRGALQKFAELSPLLGLLRRRRPRTVVEIGTAAGGSLYAWCGVAEPDATIVSIDLPGGPFGGGYAEEEIPRLRSYGRPGQTLHFLRRDSHEETTRAELVSLLAGRPIDFLMIDGDHSYEGVKRDFELYASLVAPDGLIAFHDILPHPQAPDCQVDVYWREIKPRYRHVEFLDPTEYWGYGQWGGIGVLSWGPAPTG